MQLDAKFVAVGPEQLRHAMLPSEVAPHGDAAPRRGRGRGRADARQDMTVSRIMADWPSLPR